MTPLSEFLDRSRLSGVSIGADKCCRVLIAGAFCQMLEVPCAERGHVLHAAAASASQPHLQILWTQGLGCREVDLTKEPPPPLAACPPYQRSDRLSCADQPQSGAPDSHAVQQGSASCFRTLAEVGLHFQKLPADPQLHPHDPWGYALPVVHGSMHVLCWSHPHRSGLPGQTLCADFCRQLGE